MKDTVYQIALKVNPEIIIRAAEMETGMWNEQPKQIMCEVRKSEQILTQEEKEDQKTPWSKDMMCDVIKMDPYRMGTEYLVLLPNETTRWVAEKGDHVKRNR